MSRVVLPNSNLLRYCSSGRSSLWQDGAANANAIYPSQIRIDNFAQGGSCPRGIVELYDKSVSFDDIEAAVDQRYGNWAYALSDNSIPLRLWRVEPEKFAIQLAIVGEEGNDAGEEGVSQIIYVAFTGTKCDCQ